MFHFKLILYFCGNNGVISWIMKRNLVEVSNACAVWNVVFLFVAAVCLWISQYASDLVNLTHGGSLSLLLMEVKYSTFFKLLLPFSTAALSYNLARYLRMLGDPACWLLYADVIVAIALYGIGNASSFSPALNLVHQVVGVLYHLLLLSVGVVFCVKYRGRLRWLGIFRLALFLSEFIFALVAYLLPGMLTWYLFNTLVFLLILANLLALQRTMVVRKPIAADRGVKKV